MSGDGRAVVAKARNQGRGAESGDQRVPDRNEHLDHSSHAIHAMVPFLPRGLRGLRGLRAVRWVARRDARIQFFAPAIEDEVPFFFFRRDGAKIGSCGIREG